MDVSVFHECIFAWWRANGRVLPWRDKMEGEDSGQLIVDSRETAREIRQGTRNKEQEWRKEDGKGRRNIGRDVAVGASQGDREKIFQTYFSSNSFRDPYAVVVAEMMLQQTQVERVIPKYVAWMQRWPTVTDLARATQAEVMIAWQGLGYNRRARYLWLLAREIGETYGGVWPREEKELRRLSGIGRYTARAIMSFAQGQQVGVVDVNVKRTISRILADFTDTAAREAEVNAPIFGENSKLEVRNSKQIQNANREIENLILKIRENEISNKNSEEQWCELADMILPAELADPWNQALMDFGALICTAKNPQCAVCPVARDCVANQQAISRGCGDYAGYLRGKHPPLSGLVGPDVSSRRSGRKGKDPVAGAQSIRVGKDFKDGKKIKFEETDRFFRGRIIDALREKEWTVEGLSEYMSINFNLNDRGRFEKLIDGLKKEQLLTVSAGSVRLGI